MHCSIHDPCCDPQEAIREYSISISMVKDLKPANAIVLAVAHSYYQEWSIERWRSFLKKGGVISDVKNLVPKNNLEKYGYRVWRL